MGSQHGAKPKGFSLKPKILDIFQSHPFPCVLFGEGRSPDREDGLGMLGGQIKREMLSWNWDSLPSRAGGRETPGQLGWSWSGAGASEHPLGTLINTGSQVLNPSHTLGLGVCLFKLTLAWC